MEEGPLFNVTTSRTRSILQSQIASLGFQIKAVPTCEGDTNLQIAETPEKRNHVISSCSLFLDSFVFGVCRGFRHRSLRQPFCTENPRLPKPPNNSPDEIPSLSSRFFFVLPDFPLLFCQFHRGVIPFPSHSMCAWVSPNPQAARKKSPGTIGIGLFPRVCFLWLPAPFHISRSSSLSANQETESRRAGVVITWFEAQQ